MSSRIDASFSDFWSPRHNNLRAWTGPPLPAPVLGNPVAPPGKLWLSKIYLGETITPSVLIVDAYSSGINPDEDANYAGIYSADGVLIAKTADLAAVYPTFAPASTVSTGDPGSDDQVLDYYNLGVADRSGFPQTDAYFEILVQATETDATGREIMSVTGGLGAGAGTFAVGRGFAGTTPVAHPVGSYVAMYAAAETLVGATATMPLTAEPGQSLTLDGGSVVYAALLANAEDVPGFTVLAAAGSGRVINVGLTAGNYHGAISPGTMTSLPSTIDLSTYQPYDLVWAALA
jgi:hypothetical protein